MGGKNIFKSAFKGVYIPVKKSVRWFKRLSRNMKYFTLGLVVFVLFDLYLLWYFFTFGSATPVKLEFTYDKSSTELTALDSAAHKGWIKQANYASFMFSQEQLEKIRESFERCGSASVMVRLKVLPSSRQKKFFENAVDLPLQLGFLTEEDFTARGKFISQVYGGGNRLVAQGNLQELPDVFDISVAFKKDELMAVASGAASSASLPRGFFVFSTLRTRIVAACITDAMLGFDVSSEIPRYGFAYSGGKIDTSNSSYDFSNASTVFDLRNQKNPLPEVCVGLYNVPKFKSTLQDKVIVEVNAGGERLFINNVPGATRVIIPTAALKNPYSRMTFSSNKMCVSSLFMKVSDGAFKKTDFIEANNIPVNSGEVLLPVSADPGFILNYDMLKWRTSDYEIFEWDRFDRILFFDTRNYEVQDKFFTRLAYFVEKEGFKGRLLTNDQLKGMHGYNAHDYSAESMARFFNAAVDSNFRLNYEEQLLKKILLVNGFFEADGAYVRANEGGLVSVSRETPDWSRQNLLAHEGWHTIFFRDEEFRNFVAAVYGTIDYDSRQFLLDYFRSQPSLGYDLNDEYLMHNEFMAYIMQQPLSEVSNYFVHLANRGTVMAATPYLCAYIRENKAAAFEDAASMMNDFVFDRYGIVCGNISIVRR
ncbi:hypothetical protein MSI_12430 [Treponema sp. JC4]|uniref:hypothetical protein n=1 Tax=Treponema sp. JC4 TaxID=1124982 RepID=UPI00025B0729|nr:hypothetical protein [Treponema sp. JC4]EID85244.1 hypothetical protein MSI_12430 [Treponema sp. JC4]